MKNPNWAAAAAILALAATVPVASRAQGLGDCFWSNVSDQDKTDFVAVYHSAIKNGAVDSSVYSDWLAAKRTVVDSALSKCDATPNLPNRLHYSIISSQFTQFGAAQELAANLQIKREELDQSWSAAPETVRQCLIMGAAKQLDGDFARCQAADGVSWFTQDFKTRHSLDVARGDTLMIITYVSSKARGLATEAKITEFEKGAASGAK